MANLKQLLFLNYNNYFNRIIKKYDSVADYIENRKFKYLQKVSFNENDGIETMQIVNCSPDFSPDYMLVVDNGSQIESRWFVTEWKRTRTGQYQAALKRDVVADFYEEIVESPCFIEKGFVNAENPLIYNKENFTCNQIKKGEVLLRDSSYMSWIALYYNLSKKSDLTGTVSTIEQPYVNLGTTLASWDLYARYNSQYKRTLQKNLLINVEVNDTVTEYQVQFDSEVEYNRTIPNQVIDSDLEVAVGHNSVGQLVTNAVNDNKVTLKSALSSYREEQDTFDSLMNYNNRIVKTTDNEFYKITIVKDDSGIDGYNLTSGTLYNALVSTFKPGGVWKDKFSGGFNNAFRVTIQYQNYHIVAEKLVNEVVTYNYDFRTCVDISDAPYGLLLLPYKSMDKWGRPVTIGTSSYINEELSMLIAKDLTKSGVGSSNIIYDAQIVPYCPVNLQSFVGVNTIELYVGNLDEDQFTFIYDSNSNKVSFAIHPTYCKFTKDIDIRTQLAVDLHYDNTKKKLNNQCTFLRLVSPNYNGQFEFNPARNNGVNYINVDCTYKPYMPYIKLNPDFKNLYGQDFNDATGLICGGDFSMSVVSSAWETYKMQNKNYDKIFDRQIESMDKMHDINMLKSVTNIGMSAATNALKMPDNGFMSIDGLVNAGVNLASAQASYKEQRDLAIDQHNFQLGNIQALPNSLNKVDAYNNNNKIFPFLELYSCTDEEKEIFNKKIIFEGMTVNAIGKISDYIEPYQGYTFVKGKLLRLDNIENDSHLCYTIYEEIMKGVYL